MLVKVCWTNSEYWNLRRAIYRLIHLQGIVKRQVKNTKYKILGETMNKNYYICICIVILAAMWIRVYTKASSYSGEIPISPNNIDVAAVHKEQTKTTENLITSLTVASTSIATTTKTTTAYTLPKNITGEFKAYMDYRCITDRSSDQWKMQQKAITYKNGIRMYDGKFMVALGTYFTDRCGKSFRITLDSGISFDVIVGDIKDNRHTDKTHSYTLGGNVIEFIVDTRKISRESRIRGDMSFSGFYGEIVSIKEIK